MELNSGDDLSIPENSESPQDHYSLASQSTLSITDEAAVYARAHGLTVDSLLPAWADLENDHLIASTLSSTSPGQLVEDLELEECLFRAIIPTPEHWQMPAKSLHLLHQVCRQTKEEEIEDLMSQECFSEAAYSKMLKLETPALRSDHWTDCRRLDRAVKAFLKGPLPGHRLPLEPADIEKGEGLEFPNNAMAQDKEMMSAVETESLVMNRDSLMYLMQTLKADWSEHEQREFAESMSTYKRVRAREPLTPRLSPMMQTIPEYFVPDGETCYIPEPSDPSSRLSADIEAAESRIFETDDAFWKEASEARISPERYDDIDVSEMIRGGELRPTMPPSTQQPVPRDLRFDIPVLVSDDFDANAQPSNGVLAPEDLAKAKVLVESSDTPSSSDGAGGQLVNFFRERATAVMRSAEQEKLQPLDATARVPVPVMDFSIPIPQWEESLWDAKSMFRWIQENLAADWQGHKWTYNRAAEQRMVWAPLADMKTKKLVAEDIEVNPDLLASFLTESQEDEVLNSADYVYKQPGLAIFHIGDDDDEDGYLVPLDSPTRSQENISRMGVCGGVSAPFSAENCDKPPDPALGITPRVPPPAELAALLSGRRRLIEESIQRTQSTGKRVRGLEEPPGISATDIIDPALIPSTNVLRGFMNEYTDFVPLVDNFVEMNFPKKPKLTHNSFFSPASTESCAKADDPATRLMPPPPKRTPALAPEITAPDIPPRIIISSGTSNLLINHLTTLLPGIELIPRDYTKHRHAQYDSFPGLLRNPSQTEEEADITISPATGVLLTTMVRLRQKPLPGGQTNPPPPAAAAAATITSFCRVTASVAARYERLVVLVSEGNKHSESASPLSQSDARALAEFQGFAAGLGEGVRVVYVGGGVETLARWVAALVCEHAAEAAAVRHLLLEVETFWEVFLWRAGMNVFAAQVVLGLLKVPEGSAAISPGGQMYGLPLFVMMPRERRVAFFEEVLGGRKILDRVSETLDEPWGVPAIGDDGLSHQRLELGFDGF